MLLMGKCQPGRPGRRGDGLPVVGGDVRPSVQRPLDGRLCRADPRPVLDRPALARRRTRYHRRHRVADAAGIATEHRGHRTTPARIGAAAAARPGSFGRGGAGAGAAQERGANPVSRQRQPSCALRCTGSWASHGCFTSKRRTRRSGAGSNSSSPRHAPARADQRPDRRVAARGRQLCPALRVLRRRGPRPDAGGVYRVRFADKGLEFGLELACGQPCW